MRSALGAETECVILARRRCSRRTAHTRV